MVFPNENVKSDKEKLEKLALNGNKEKIKEESKLYQDEIINLLTENDDLDYNRLDILINEDFQALHFD
jgi:hypothetical protein